jgi:hypothetical protein
MYIFVWYAVQYMYHVSLFYYETQSETTPLFYMKNAPDLNSRELSKLNLSRFFSVPKQNYVIVLWKKSYLFTPSPSFTIHSHCVIYLLAVQNSSIGTAAEQLNYQPVFCEAIRK